MSIDRLDQIIMEKMKKLGEPAARISLFIIFFWFGILKPFGLSAAEALVLKTVEWMPVLSAKQWLVVIGWWEVVIGIAFLFRKTTRLAIGLLFLQMMGTFMPLFILPEITFQENGIPFLPTLEGQYIVKNIIIISAAIVIGGNLQEKKKAA